MHQTPDNIPTPPEQGPHQTAAQTAVLMWSLLLLSKILGFIRELALASSFGTSYVIDVLEMAQSIPNALFGGILGSVSVAYTPLFSKLVETRGKGSGNEFTNQVLTFIVFVSIAALALGALFSTPLLKLFAPGFEAYKVDLANYYLKVAFSYIFFTASIGIIEAYLRYNDRFLQPIIAGYIYNAGVITIILLSTHTDYHYLVFGPALGYCLQFILILIAAGKSGFHYRPNMAFSESIRQIMKLAIPVFIGSSVSQINTLVDKMLASSLSEGSIASLKYGLLLTSTISSMTVSIIATIFYPKITRAASREDWEFYNSATQKTISVAIILSIPFSLGAIAFSNQVVQVIYERGAFSGTSTALTAEAFRFYSIGLVFMSLGSLVSTIFTSLREVKITVICSAISIVCNIILNLILIAPMQHSGLALATSLAGIVNLLLLSRFLKKRHPHIHAFPQRRKILTITLAAVLSVGAAILAYQILLLVWMPRMIYLGLSVAVAIVIYLILLKMFRIEEVKILGELFHR